MSHPAHAFFNAKLEMPNTRLRNRFSHIRRIEAALSQISELSESGFDVEPATKAILRLRARMATFLWILFALCSIVEGLDGRHGISPLLKKLFLTRPLYKAGVRPVKQASDSVSVQCHISISHIEAVVRPVSMPCHGPIGSSFQDEKQQTVKMHGTVFSVSSLPPPLLRRLARTSVSRPGTTQDCDGTPKSSITR